MTGSIRSLAAVIVVGLAILTAAMVPPEAAAATASPAPAATSAPVATITAKKKCKSFPPACLIRFNKKETKYFTYASVSSIAIFITSRFPHPVVLFSVGFAAKLLFDASDAAIAKGRCVQVLFRFPRPKVKSYRGREKGCK